MLEVEMLNLGLGALGMWFMFQLSTKHLERLYKQNQQLAKVMSKIHRELQRRGN